MQIVVQSSPVCCSVCLCRAQYKEEGVTGVSQDGDPVERVEEFTSSNRTKGRWGQTVMCLTLYPLFLALHCAVSHAPLQGRGELG